MHAFCPQGQVHSNLITFFEWALESNLIIFSLVHFLILSENSEPYLITFLEHLLILSHFYIQIWSPFMHLFILSYAFIFKSKLTTFLLHLHFVMSIKVKFYYLFVHLISIWSSTLSYLLESNLITFLCTCFWSLSSEGIFTLSMRKVWRHIHIFYEEGLLNISYWEYAALIWFSQV